MLMADAHNNSIISFTTFILYLIALGYKGLNPLPDMSYVPLTIKLYNEDFFYDFNTCYSNGFFTSY